MKKTNEFNNLKEAVVTALKKASFKELAEYIHKEAENLKTLEEVLFDDATPSEAMKLAKSVIESELQESLKKSDKKSDKKSNKKSNKKSDNKNNEIIRHKKVYTKQVVESLDDLLKSNFSLYERRIDKLYRIYITTFEYKPDLDLFLVTTDENQLLQITKRDVISELKNKRFYRLVEKQEEKKSE